MGRSPRLAAAKLLSLCRHKWSRSSFTRVVGLAKGALDVDGGAGLLGDICRLSVAGGWGRGLAAAAATSPSNLPKKCRSLGAGGSGGGLDSSRRGSVHSSASCMASASSGNKVVSSSFAVPASPKFPTVAPSGAGQRGVPLPRELPAESTFLWLALCWGCRTSGSCGMATPEPGKAGSNPLCGWVGACGCCCCLKLFLPLLLHAATAWAFFWTAAAADATTRWHWNLTLRSRGH